MTSGSSNIARTWQSYTGPNLGYVIEQYERYAADPESVAPAFRELFQRTGTPPAYMGGDLHSSTGSDWTLVQKTAAAAKLVWNIREYGHLAADIDPLGSSAAASIRLIDPEAYNLTPADLERIPAPLIWDNAPEDGMNGREAIDLLRQSYTRTIAYEFSHVHEERERDWLNKHAENYAVSAASFSEQERVMLLKRLIEAQQFEHFLHRTFIGQKRFSIEGNDALVPMLDEALRSVAKQGGSRIMIGMAHRGRLNVLAHVLRKPYGKIFAEFHHAPNKDLVPSEGSTGINYGWTGDVKYHLGAERIVEEGGDRTIQLVLANNPSHLEFVNPVVEGFTRAAQDNRREPGFPKQDRSKAAAVLIHGDAAFAGEGIVAETLNFNRLSGYNNGGTIHIIVNNRLGFTTDIQDARSTHYASDLAKGFEIPVVHVNADDPEACIAAVRMACEYRGRFGKDFLIDMIGYRRYGHNESDDPETTQPVMYSKLRSHPAVSELYARKLTAEGIMTEDNLERMKQDALSRLQEAYEEMRRGDHPEKLSSLDERTQAKLGASVPETAVPLHHLREINAELLKRPEGFRMYPKLQRILERRANALDGGRKVDWALAETLAFATILADGKPIRLSGQDSQRGTFAHRHLVLHDTATGEPYCPLHTLPQAKASCAILNSPLSEAAVLGFEYGYSVLAPETLVIWEAQYGDFANAGQVIIDQFIAAGRSKWRQKSSLILLLPHGYEGQGPEHSSARLERYLQLSAENNWTVVNMTRAAQYFHLLRRQASLTDSDQARPLVVMAPKSLIRHPRVASEGSELSEGTFQAVLEQSQQSHKKKETSLVRRLILCSGKVAVDLEEAMEADDTADRSWLHVIRVEQLYPFPAYEIANVVQRFPNAKELVWLQEEPQNMGAWSFMEPRLRKVVQERIPIRYIGRPEHSSTASGYQDVHSTEQQRLLENALDGSYTD